MKKLVMILMTDSYAGNFEREAVAYCTGLIGECEVGEEFVDSIIAEKFESYVDYQVDHNGTARPVSIGRMENDELDGFQPIMGENNCKNINIVLNMKTPQELIDLIDQRAREFFETNVYTENVKYLGYYLVEISNNVDVIYHKEV